MVLNIKVTKKDINKLLKKQYKLREEYIRKYSRGSIQAFAINELYNITVELTHIYNKYENFIRTKRNKK